MFSSYSDLVQYFGQEEVDKASQTTEFDTDINDYVTVTDRTKMEARANWAISLACEKLKAKLRCCGYDIAEVEEKITMGLEFPILKMYNTKIAMMILKDGSDCEKAEKCSCEFKDFCECNPICSTSNECLSKESCFEVEDKSVCIPSMCDICCNLECSCCQEDLV